MLILKEYMLVVGVAMVFMALILVVFWIVRFTRHSTQKRSLLKKAGAFQAKTTAEPVQEKEMRSGPKKGIIFGLVGLLGSKVAKERVSDYSGMRVTFLKAGMRNENAPSVFWGTKIILALVLPLGFLLFKISVPDLIISPTMIILILILAGLGGFYLPDLWLYNRIAKRKQVILDGFPDALDLLVVGVEAGMGLDASMHRVATEMAYDNKILSDELNLYSLELRAGMLRRDALKNLATRTDLTEMSNLTTLLIQTDKFGTSVSQALRVFSDSLRVQRMQRAEELAGKLPVKMMIPLMFFIFPALFVVIMGPGVIQIYRSMFQM